MKAGKFMQEATMEKLLDCLVTAGVDFYAPEDRPENGANGEKTPHPYYTPECHHTHIEMLFRLNGRLLIYINGIWHPLESDRLQIMLPGTRHTEHYSDISQPYSLFWLTVNPVGLILHTTEWNPAKGYAQSPYRIGMKPAAASALWQCGSKTPVKRPRFHYLLMECLDECLEQGLFNQMNYRDQVVEQVQNYLDEYFSRQLSLADLGKMFRYSPKHLNMLFKKQTGIPLHQYLGNKRLEYAAELLRTTDCTIHDAALSAGIPDCLYFSRIFRKKYDISPSEYIQKFRIVTNSCGSAVPR